MTRDLPETMTVVEISAPGGPEVLVPARRPLPRPGPGEVLIRLTHAGVNRPDALQRRGLYAPPPGASDLPGLEGAGHLAALGAGVSGWQIGAAVSALLPGGGYAEYALAPSDHCLPVPEGLPLAEAACLPEAMFTVWANVFDRAGLKPGERFLVHGGASGIGTTAIAMAKLWGARVFATAGGPERARACEARGAERGIDYRSEDFVEVLRAEGGADVILCMVGGSYFGRNLQALADDGRLAQIAFLESPQVQANLSQMMTRRLTLTGSTLRPRSVPDKARMAAELRRHVWPWVAQGRLRPVMDRAFPLVEAREAHRHLEAGVLGKVVLEVAP